MKSKNALFILLIFNLLISNSLLGNKSLSGQTPDNQTTHRRNTIEHTVRKGETVYSIANAYNISPQDIYKLNPKSEKGIKDGSVLIIPKLRKPTRYSTHLIEPKETLFSIARMYNISTEDIKNANFGVVENSLHVGSTINIPIFEDSINTEVNEVKTNIHIVAKGETLYSISKMYNTTTDNITSTNPKVRNGLQEGMRLDIPKPTPTENELVTNILETINNQTSQETKKNILKIGLLFPFIDDSGTVSRDKLVEYYQGFLLAVKAMKEKGMNAEIYTFDVSPEKDSNKLNALLETTELQNLDAIIGGVSKEKIDILSNYSKKKGIKYIIPFDSQNTNVESNTGAFQLTSAHSSLYPQVISAFKNTMSDRNIVFVSEAGSNNNKNDFVSELKKELTKSNIPFKTVDGTTNQTSDIEKALTNNGNNLIIPTSSSETSLKRISTSLKVLANRYQISLFGYPEWQTYTQSTADLYKFDTYIYSIFFVDEKQKEVVDFLDQYKQWYNTGLVNSFPKYAFLGYDAGLFFLTALDKYKGNLESSISQLRVPTLQSSIFFKQISPNGGFVNSGIYLVRFKTDKTIEKIEIRK